ncbi:ribosomal maturation YjgA family protein [Nostoc sp.]|uniref:ribosomal maturation YjgA family protein n=1 Tax=Nostoc sp. TaxID=1180 RepID=UPI002FFC8EC9
MTLPTPKGGAMLIFNKKYFYFTAILFLIEVCIAVFVNESFIRPFIGDVLVVILIYCFVRTFSNIHSSIVALSAFAFSCTIEILQYFNFVNTLGLQKYKILAVALGSVFDWKDIIAYGIGTITVLWLENRT